MRCAIFNRACLSFSISLITITSHELQREDATGTTMTLTELRYIVTLAQERHFGRAAERCHVSQPTLSVAVKKLEDELEVALFERSKSTVQVTPLGEKVVAQAQRVLEQSGLIFELAKAGKDQLANPCALAPSTPLGPTCFPIWCLRWPTLRHRCRCTSKRA